GSGHRSGWLSSDGWPLSVFHSNPLPRGDRHGTTKHGDLRVSLTEDYAILLFPAAPEAKPGVYLSQVGPTLISSFQQRGGTTAFRAGRWLAYRSWKCGRESSRPRRREQWRARPPRGRGGDRV